jgi:hypothetical protein
MSHRVGVPTEHKVTRKYFTLPRILPSTQGYYWVCYPVLPLLTESNKTSYDFRTVPHTTDFWSLHTCIVGQTL